MLTDRQTNQHYTQRNKNNLVGGVKKYDYSQTVKFTDGFSTVDKLWMNVSMERFAATRHANESNKPRRTNIPATSFDMQYTQTSEADYTTRCSVAVLGGL